jgi:hypothetical protein
MGTWPLEKYNCLSGCAHSVAPDIEVVLGGAQADAQAEQQEGYVLFHSYGFALDIAILVTADFFQRKYKDLRQVVFGD